MSTVDHERYQGEEYVEVDEMNGYLCTYCGKVMPTKAAWREHICLAGWADALDRSIEKLAKEMERDSERYWKRHAAKTKPDQH